MEAKHTPGPWAVWPMGDILTITCTGKDRPHPQEGMHIAHVSLPNEQHLQWVPTVKANARLIAAAPEMLAALIALHAVASVDRDKDYSAVTNAAAIIAKATS